MTHARFTAALAAASFIALPALAHDFDVDEAQEEVAELVAEQYADATDLPMTVTATVAHLEDLGYTEIEDFDVDDGAYRIEATDPGGEAVEITLDAMTGEVVESEED